MPRRYRMKSRASAIEDTQARIVAAAKALQAEQGVQGTSYDEIARRAGVAQATVYRHFPTLEDLIPACARSIVVLQSLTPESIANIFQNRTAPLQRIEWLIQGTCECYERDGGWLQAARREGDLIPALSQVVHVQQSSLRELVQAAMRDIPVSEHSVRVLAALIDFPLWKSLRDEGLSAADATSQVLELVRYHLSKENLI